MPFKIVNHVSMPNNSNSFIRNVSPFLKGVLSSNSIDFTKCEKKDVFLSKSSMVIMYIRLLSTFSRRYGISWVKFT